MVEAAGDTANVADAGVGGATVMAGVAGMLWRPNPWGKLGDLITQQTAKDVMRDFVS